MKRFSSLFNWRHIFHRIPNKAIAGVIELSTSWRRSNCFPLITCWCRHLRQEGSREWGWQSGSHHLQRIRSRPLQMVSDECVLCFLGCWLLCEHARACTVLHGLAGHALSCTLLAGFNVAKFFSLYVLLVGFIFIFKSFWFLCFSSNLLFFLT